MNDDLLDAASRLGFALRSGPTDNGQIVWEWRHGDGPRPQFVTERSARQWMSEWIERCAACPPDDLTEARRARDRASSMLDEADSA